MNLTEFQKKASHFPAIKGLSWLSPPAEIPSEQELKGYKKSQHVALEAVKEVAKIIREGWTEKQAADLLNTYLQDIGVRSFFHRGFAWYGERTRFTGIRKYSDFGPSSRVLLPGEVYILDVAPIYDGYICDIGYTGCLGENLEHKKAIQFLRKLRKDIPLLFTEIATGAVIWHKVNERIQAAGYDNIHQLYPFSLLGHRLYRTRWTRGQVGIWNFGWQSFWEIASRGVFGQLLNQNHEGELKGLWAIEPHLGGKGFGAKFEEILMVDSDGARWIAPEEQSCLPENA